ncbi:MAG TPA: hypothetical protein VFS34_13715 [Thermoanaerobaculia bacterium]|nr:hypothetical protein [Thermoanaerobaculia bacterium]
MTEHRRRRRPLHLAIRDWPGAVRIALAIVCLLVGLAGVVLPILPGWPFLFVGLAILTTIFPGLRRFWRARMRQHPKLRRALKKVQTKKPNAR